MLSPYQQLHKKMTDSERDAFLLKKTLELISIHEKMLKKMEEIGSIKAAPSTVPGPRGFKGEAGNFTREEVVEMLVPYLPRAKDGYTPTKSELLEIIKPLIPDIKIEEIARVAKAMVLNNLPKPESIDFEKILKTRKFTVKDIDGLDQSLKALDHQTRRGYLHGGGVPSLSAGTGITLTPKSDGGFTVSTNGFQVPLSGVIDGVNKTFVWATTPRVIFVDQGRPMQATNSAPDSTVNWTGTTTTVFTIAPTFDLFSIA